MSERDRDAADQKAILASRDVSILQLINVLLRQRRVLFASMLTVTVLLVLVRMVAPAEYTADVAFVPQSADGQQGRLANLAGQLGLRVPGGAGAGQSPAFFAELAQSKEILLRLLDVRSSAFWQAGDSNSGDPSHLIEALDIDEDDPQRAREEAVERIQKLLSAKINPEIGIVRLGATTHSATLSAHIIATIITLLSDFNQETRQSQARAEREFVAGRLQEATGELENAEQELRIFLEKNRLFQQSPALVFENDRLQRQVSLRQSTVLSLANAYEQARIDEVRDTPVITIVEQVRIPYDPNSRRLVVRFVLGILLGLMIGGLIAFIREFFRSSSTSDPDAATEFQHLVEALKSDLRGFAFWRRRR